MEYHVAKTIGLNTDQKASQVIHNFCDDDNVFLAVLTLEADDAFVFGRQLLSDLAEKFCESEVDSGERLTEAFSEAKKALEGKQFSLLLASVSTKVLYLIGTGEITATLKREETISPLLQNGSEQLISGFLQGGDKIFLATDPLQTFLGSNLANSLKLPLDEWEDEMSVRLNEDGVESGNLAGLLLEVEEPRALGDEAAAPQSEGESVDDNIMPLSTQEDSEGQVSAAGLASKLRGGLSKANHFLPKSGRVRLSLAVVIIMIIIAGIAINFFGARGEQKNQEVTRLLDQARSAKTEAEGLRTLNAAEAEKKLTEAISLVDQALKINSNSKEAQDLKRQLEGSSADILQKFSQTQTTELMDLASVKDGFSGDKLSLLGSSGAALDANSSLLSLDLEEKKAEELAEGEDLGKAGEVVFDEDMIFVYSEDKGILKIDLGSKKLTEAAEVDDEWGTIKGISTFGSNVYLLDEEKDQIWKYLPTTNGFSNKRNYFTADTKVDLDGAVSMQIDSSVYVLKQNGEIFKFTKGAKDGFSLSGLDKPLKDPKAIYASADTENLYVLDSGNGRVVVLGKSGEYKAQYGADKLGVVSGFGVDEKVKKIYLLEGSKIFTMDLK